MAGDTKLFRQWTLLRMIGTAGGSATIKWLISQTGVSEKTIRRDVALLRRVGFPVEETVGEFGRKTFSFQTANLPEVGLTYDEALAIFFCRQAVLPLAGTFFWDSAQTAFRKIQVSLGQRAAKYVERMVNRIYQTHAGGAYADKSELIDQLLIALEECKATFITYQSARSSEPLSYPVEPYGLIEHRGSLYLVGYSQQHDEVRHWKVDRIDEAEVTKVSFQRPADFDLEKHLAGSFGIYHGKENIRVRVRFAPAAARYVREKRMHRSQRITGQAGGSTLVEWTVSSLVEIKSFILSFGAAAEVLEPTELRTEMAAELQLAAQQYSASKPRGSDGQAVALRKKRARTTS